MLLLLVLLLVLGSFGLLVTALVTDETGWAWGSVAASLVAGVLLTVDWLIRRKVARDTVQPAPRAPTPTVEQAEPVAETEPAVSRAEPPGRREEPDASPVRAQPAPTLDPEVEPGEEDTDAADALAVSELTYEVVVIDERPRYHLAECEWLAGRPTIPLPVREARELGFTPCALCTPDAKLATRHRLARR